jgi:GntR family transcriptional regulator
MDIPIDPSDPAPMYEQIREGLAAANLTGDLRPGEPLPSIRSLARDLRVSVITTTRAYNELVAEGLADAVRGKGVFVRDQDPDAVRERALGRIDLAFAEAAARISPGSCPSPFVGRRTVRADERAAHGMVPQPVHRSGDCWDRRPRRVRPRRVRPCRE